MPGSCKDRKQPKSRRRRAIHALRQNSLIAFDASLIIFGLDGAGNPLPDYNCNIISVQQVKLRW
ncbi:hypothetical protein CK223_31690 [Mesorhizobium loti]|nr:hypothetical protein CK223_31690 [Mesorhizobium loti]